MEKNSIKTIEINNNKFFYAEANEVKNEDFQSKVHSYLNGIEKNWNLIKIIIIVTFTISICLLIIIIICVRNTCCCCLKNKETKRLNMIEALLPEPKLINQLRRKSADSFDDTPKRMIEISKNNR